MGKRDKSLENDAEIWARVAETATPLKARGRVARDAVPASPAKPAEPKAPAKSATKRAAKKTAEHGAAAPAEQGTGRAPQTGLDRQTARKLDKGRLAIEARLDLHGMRQTEAHGALRKFLHWARQKDYRHVLVITGKGSPSDAASFYAEETRGVLRQSVPIWLSHGDLASHIVSFSEAPRGLGGEGALYVRLRKSDRTRRKTKE